MKRILILYGAFILFLISFATSQEEHHEHHQNPGIENLGDSMAPGHQHKNNPHMYMTTLRPANPDDLRRSETLLSQLRSALRKYKNYKEAEKAGYKIFFGQVPLPEYHFTNRQLAMRERKVFDPENPSSLLYKKTSSGYELTGVMFTAPRSAGEEDLNDRVPLSVARWHKHINICLAPKSKPISYQRSKQPKFGPRGSITTEAACKAEGGRWFDQIFGWMVHVYPFETDPGKIWGH